MAFMRKQAVIEATDLNTITPQDTETRIAAGVKKYATNEATYAKADGNTPYLGHIVGIESSNLADITMSIERQFLTKMTTKTPLAEGSAEYRLTPGELGKLRILDGQDALAATPGLSVKMLMDLGHMPRNEAYLQNVMSFAYVMAVGDGWKMADALKKMTAKAEKLQGGERSCSNVLVEQARIEHLIVSRTKRNLYHLELFSLSFLLITLLHQSVLHQAGPVTPTALRISSMSGRT